ncbi:hypothetical protein C8R45DRAFT_1186244 [Mycena sanguinolenta]|nr:hypothetical protein C8R45DRAFT_1186244 [Mycena sanguinolenta]
MLLPRLWWSFVFVILTSVCRSNLMLNPWEGMIACGVKSSLYLVFTFLVKSQELDTDHQYAKPFLRVREEDRPFEAPPLPRCARGVPRAGAPQGEIITLALGFIPNAALALDFSTPTMTFLNPIALPCKTNGTGMGSLQALSAILHLCNCQRSLLASTPALNPFEDPQYVVNRAAPVAALSGQHTVQTQTHLCKARDAVPCPCMGKREEIIDVQHLLAPGDGPQCVVEMHEMKSQTGMWAVQTGACQGTWGCSPNSI